MSSYLNIYLVPKRKDKDTEKQYLLLQSYSRNSDVYEVFYENINPVFAGNEEKYTTLTKENVQNILNDVSKSINLTKEKLKLYEKYASGHPDYIQSIIDEREVLKDYEQTYGDVAFIGDIVSGIIDDYNSFEEVCCNID